MKSVLKIIGCGILGVITLVVGVFVYSSITSSCYEEQLLPYVEDSAEILSSWNYKRIRPLMHPYILEAGDEDSMVKTIKVFSKLGELKAMSKPKYINLKSGYNSNFGKYTIITYRLNGFYQNGEAVIDISVIDNKEQISIYHFGVNVSPELFNTNLSTNENLKDKIKGSWVGSYEFDNLRSSWCATHKNDGKLLVLFRDKDLISGKDRLPLVLEGTWSISGNYILNETRSLDLDGNYIDDKYHREKYKILTLNEDSFTYQGLRNDKVVFETKRISNCGRFLSQKM